MDWLMEDAIHSAAGQSLARMSVEVGVTSELHHHSNCTETIHVLKGEIEQLREKIRLEQELPADFFVG